MSGQNRSAAEKAKQVVGETVEAVEETVDESTNATAETLGDLITIPRETFQDLLQRLERAERPVHVKVKDAVVANRRRIALGATTVAVLGAAAYAVTHKDSLLEGVENVSETAELGAQSVKKDARKARTGSTTK